MIRVVTSTSAAARLAAARRFLHRRPPSAEVIIVGASRGAADDLVRVGDAPVGRDVRLVAIQPDRTGRSRGDLRISPTRGGRPAARRRRRRWRRGRCSTPWRPASSPTSSRWPACPAFRRRSRGRFTSCAWPASPRIGWRRARRLPASRPRPPAGARRGAARSARRSTIARRCFAPPPTAWTHRARAMGGSARGAPGRADRLARRARSSSPRLPRGSSTCSRPCPTATSVPRAAWQRIGGAFQLDTAMARRRSAPTPISRTCGAMSSRTIGRRSASVTGDVRLFSAPGEGREAVEIVRRVLDEAARGVRFDEMAVFLRIAAAVPRPARARVRARRRAGVLRSRHPPARSRRPRVRRAALVRGRRAVGEAVRRIPVARPGAAAGHRRAATRAAAPAASADAPSLLPASDEVFGELARRGRTPTIPESAVEPAPPLDSDDEAIVAGTLRSPWKWEELIVESAVVGGRTRHEGKARWRRRLDGLAADYDYRIDEL